jgi:hypothetical protein
MYSEDGFFLNTIGILCISNSDRHSFMITLVRSLGFFRELDKLQVIFSDRTRGEFSRRSCNNGKC